MAISSQTSPRFCEHLCRAFCWASILLHQKKWLQTSGDNDREPRRFVKLLQVSTYGRGAFTDFYAFIDLMIFYFYVQAPSPSHSPPPRAGAFISVVPLLDCPWTRCARLSPFPVFVSINVRVLWQCASQFWHLCLSLGLCRCLSFVLSESVPAGVSVWLNLCPRMH